MESYSITSDWSLSVWDAMKFIVTEILIKPFDILQSIPLGFGNATVMDFIIGVGIVGIAVFFFWRAGTQSVSSAASSQMRRDKVSKGGKNNNA